MIKTGIQPFWFWNGAMDKEEIIRQIREMKEQGISGFMIHPRQGMEVPYLSEAYFECIDVAVEEAKCLDMEVWLYDEYPYPSGVTAGQVTLDHPEYQCKMLEKAEYQAASGETVVLDMPWGQILTARAYRKTNGMIDWSDAVDLSSYIGTAYQEEIFQFSGLTKYNHKRYFTGEQMKRLWWTAPEGEWQILVFIEVVMTGFKYFDTFIDTLNPHAIRYYLETTHQRYKMRFGAEFGKTIKGIFTDEITAFPPERPWSPRLPQIMVEKTGINLLDYLPVLFDFDMGEETDRVLYAYWNTCTDTFIESYDKQVYEWCQEHSIYFIGEKPILRSKELKFTHCPGIDAGHQKAGEIPLLTPGKYRANAKIAASAGHFYKKEAVLCEAFHSIGWGMTLQDMKWTFDWLSALGIDWLVIHAFFYTTNGLKKHDAPPSAFYQMPWWKDMHQLSNYVEQINHKRQGYQRKVPVILVDPVTSVWTAKAGEKKEILGQFEQLQAELLKSHIDYYIIDPQLLAQGEVVRHKGQAAIKIGGEHYSCIILPAVTNLEDPCFLKLKAYAGAGGNLGAVGSLAQKQIMEENPGAWMHQYFKSGQTDGLYGETAKALCRKVKERLGLNKIEVLDDLEPSEILCTEYEKEGEEALYFIVNTGGNDRTIKLAGFEMPIRLAAYEAGYYQSSDYRKQQGEDERPATVTYELSMDEEYTIHLEQRNVLRIGSWDIYAEQSKESSSRPVESMPVIDQLEKAGMKVPLHLRKQFGCPKRLLLKDDRYRYQAVFEMEKGLDKKLPVFLVMEPGAIQGSFRICLNGEAICREDFLTGIGYAPDNLSVSVNQYLHEGRNELQIFVDASHTFDGVNCPLYLMGSFGVRIGTDHDGLIPLPGQGRIGAGADNGTPYYAGVISYSGSIDLGRPLKGQKVTIRIFDKRMQDSAELLLNGISLGICSWSPYQWEVPEDICREGTQAVTLKVANTMIGLFEGQYFSTSAYRYESYRGMHTEIEAYEAVVPK